MRIVEVAAAHGHSHLVLGAWGCGVFRNDPTVVAGAFAAALRRINAFERVVFAVLDRTPKETVFRAFFDQFGNHKPGVSHGSNE